MKYKAKVLARFPDACLVLEGRMAQHWLVRTGTPEGYINLDIDSVDHWQGKTAAWRSAYFWCVRNPPIQSVRLRDDGTVCRGC